MLRGWALESVARADYKQNAGLDTGQMWPKGEPYSGRDPNMSKDVGTTQLEVKGMLECKGLTKWEQEGVGGVELFHRFGLGSGVPGIVGLTLPCLRNKV